MLAKALHPEMRLVSRTEIQQREEWERVNDPERWKVSHDPPDMCWVSMNTCKARVEHKPRLSQAELAKKAGIAVRTIEMLESCPMDCNLTVDSLSKIARALGMPTSKLFEKNKDLLQLKV